jgi:hypothetical protein
MNTASAVQDPPPALENACFVHSFNFNFAFSPSDNMLPQVTTSTFKFTSTSCCSRPSYSNHRRLLSIPSQILRTGLQPNSESQQHQCRKHKQFNGKLMNILDDKEADQKHQFDVITLSFSTTGLTLATYNTIQVSR